MSQKIWEYETFKKVEFSPFLTKKSNQPPPPLSHSYEVTIQESM